MKKEKLDPLSKILVATSAINYMANSIYSVNEQIKRVQQGMQDKKVFEEGIKEKDRLLSDTVTKLGKIMEDLGNNMNNDDAICAIDQRATSGAFEIIVLGRDNVSE